MVEHRTVAPTAGGSIPLVHPREKAAGLHWMAILEAACAGVSLLSC